MNQTFILPDTGKARLDARRGSTLDAFSIHGSGCPRGSGRLLLFEVCYTQMQKKLNLRIQGTTLLFGDSFNLFLEPWLNKGTHEDLLVFLNFIAHAQDLPQVCYTRQ